MGKITTVGIDLAKRVFQVVAEDRKYRELENRRVQSREALVEYLRELPSGVLVAMEVGFGSQGWARRIEALGHHVRLLPAQLVEKHRIGPKNDPNDARAILRALRDEAIHPVPVKTPAQLALQAAHRARQGWVWRKSSLSSQIRGLLIDHGVCIRKGERWLREALPRALESAELPLPDVLRDVLAVLWLDWQWQDKLIEDSDRQITQMAREDEDARRLDTIPGFGAITASALACKGVDPNAFRSGRMFAAYFGAVPSQHSSGEKVRLGRMSRCGDRYIRCLVINGAHAVLNHLKADSQEADSRRLQRWIKKHGRKGAAVRLANRNLRMAWALLKNGTTFQRNRRTDNPSKPAPSPTVETAN